MLEAVPTNSEVCSQPNVSSAPGLQPPAITGTLNRLSTFSDLSVGLPVSECVEELGIVL